VGGGVKRETDFRGVGDFGGCGLNYEGRLARRILRLSVTTCGRGFSAIFNFPFWFD
jgi:hypothetical protein